MPKPTAKPQRKGAVLFDDADDTPWHARNGGKDQGTPSSAQVAALRASAERLPVPPRQATRYPAIHHFDEIINGLPAID